MSVTSCSIERDGRIDVVLAWGLLSTSPTLYFNEMQVYTKIRALPSGTSSDFRTPDLEKKVSSLHIDGRETWRRSERDKLDVVCQLR